MKKLPIFLAIGAIALVAYAMVYLDGGNVKINTSKSTKTEKTAVEELDEFDKLQVDGIFEVDVTYGSEEKIEIEAPNEIQKAVKLKVKSGTLIVKLDKNTYVSSKKGFKIHISTAKLNGFMLDGAASVKLNNTLKDDSFSIESSGAASFKGRLDVAEAEIELDGASSVKLSGTATTANLNLSGAGNLRDYDFKVKNLNVDMSGASSAKLTSLNSIGGNVSGASSLKYGGDPNVIVVSESGAGSIGRQ